MKTKYLDKQTLFLLLIIVFLLIALPLTLLLSRQRQEIRKRASVSGGTATVQLDPSSGTNIAVGGNYPVVIKASATSTPENKGISGFRFVLSYSYSGATSPFQPVTISDITKGFPDDTDGNWSFLKEVSADGKTITINGIFNTTTGYQISTPKTFATINFKPQNTGTVTVNFDASMSVVLAKGGALNTDILEVPDSPAGTYTVGGGATGTPTPTGGMTGTPTPTTTPGATVTPTVTPTPTGGVTPTPTGAPVISRVSNYCGKPSETILTIYGTNFGASQGTSKVYFRYKASSIAENSTYKEALADIVSWTNTTVFAIVPTVDFGGNNDVVSKVKLVKQGYTNYPANFPPGEVAFFSISRDSARNIGDLDCNNAVDYKDFAILFNNWPRQ